MMRQIAIMLGAMAMAACTAEAQNDDMVLIKGGTFQMGSPVTEAERDADEVLHEVTVADFMMSSTEVSQQEYELVMGKNPSERKGKNLPVENVTWYYAIAYCNALSQRENLTPCYEVNGTNITWRQDANGYRLPTEAEWEFAARGGRQTPFNFGDYVHDSDANCYNAYGYNNDASGHWVNGYLEHTVEVTNYPTNAYGLYNMHGNVAEWTWDWYAPYGTNPEEGHYKVVRGGGWNDFPKHIRSAYRSAFPADVPLYATGFRVVRSVTPGEGVRKSICTAKANNPGGKVLIVYFSQTGNTDGLAQKIHDMTGYDIFRIKRATPYSATYNSQGLYAEALKEYREVAVPDLKAYVPNISDYDVILLGYCNWWASIPAPVRTFLLHDDFSGKTIVPFCSMGGDRFGQTISAIAKLAPESVILKGLDVTYSSYDTDRIKVWLDNIKQYQQTSAINVIKSNTDKKNAIYSLNGQKVTEPHKGIYIVNGEKQVVK